MQNKERTEKEEKWLDGWMHPIWEGREVFRETFAMVEENGIVEARFLFPPEKVLKVESYDGQTVYEEGKDFLVEGDLLKLTPDSSIPHTGWSAFLYETREEAEEALDKGEFRLDFGPVMATDGRYLNLNPIGHPQLVTRWQVAVTYTTAEKQFPAVQKSCMDQLPRLGARLAKGDPVSIVLFGDSICCGFDCSGKYGQEPGQPVWDDLLLHRMREKWDSPVSLRNTSLGGMDTEWAIERAHERAGQHRPDLAILGFGMNDRCRPEEYREKTLRFIEAVRKESPETEILLLSTSLPNPLAATAPMHFWAYQDQYAEVLRDLCQEGIALADVQEVHREIAKRKRYIDVTGNWLNHPNDFLARIYAQVTAAALGLL